MANSINTNISAYFAQSNIAKATSAAQTSVGRLSSGNFITKASDDVARLSIGTSFSTTVRTLRQALVNASQGVSLLQVADGALGQITEILQRQKTLATQASSGNLSNADRGFLNQEFQALAEQIDFIASTSTFNGVNLLSGALSTAAKVTSATNQASAASGTITFSTTITDGQIATIAGVNLTFSDSASTTLQVQIGADNAGTVANLAAKLTALSETATYATSLGQATYEANGEVLTITARSGGAFSNNFRIDTSSTALASQGFSGAFGGTKLNMFGVGFASATASVTDATPSVTEPFDAGAVLYARIGTRTPLALYTLADGDSLQDIVNGINSSSSTTKVTASVVYDGSATANQRYNIELQYADSTDKISLYSAGFYTGTDAVQTLNSGTSSYTLLNTVDADGDIIDASPTALLPFDTGQDLIATLGDTSFTIATAAQLATANGLGAGLSIASLATAINSDSDAQLYGIRAVLLDSAGNATDTAADARNIRIDYANGTNANVGGVADGLKLNIYQAGSFIPNQIETTTVQINNGGYSFELLAADITAAPGDDMTTAALTAGTVNQPFMAGETLNIVIDGHTITHTLVGGDTLLTIATALNANAQSQGIYGFKAQVNGTDGAGSAADRNILISYFDEADAGKVLTNAVVTSNGAFGLNTTGALTYADATNFAQTQTTVSATRTFGLNGGADDGLGQGDTSVTGTIGDAILTGLSQSSAKVVLNFPEIADADLTASTNFGTAGSVYITVGGKNFAFTTSTETAKAPDEITIGSTLQETLDNAVSTINSYLSSGLATGTTEYELNQLNITRSGNSLVFEGKGIKDLTKIDGTTTSSIALSGTFVSGASLTNSGNLNNGSGSDTYGVDVTGISNVDFTGRISGFTATYQSANTVDVSVKVGDYTYTATGVNTNPTANTTIRFFSDELADGSNGGYFDVQLQENRGVAVTNATTANTFATRLDNAFSSLSFTQKRTVDSYNGTANIVAGSDNIGSLLGSSVRAQLSSYDDLKINGVNVSAPSGTDTDGKITININGVDYSTSAGLGSQLGANQTFKLSKVGDSSQFLEFTTGSTAIVFDTAEKAAAVEAALKEAFGAVEGSAAISFQIGLKSTESLSVSIASSTTDSLYNGQALSITTIENAAAASEALDVALATVTSIRANVGALQSRFNFASANIQISVQNQDASRSELLDTDIATESTNYATAQVQLQAGISVLAQANQQLQNLLKLLG